MIRFGVLALIAGLLQLSVPTYGLRLVRRFGAQQVGWFIVVAFSSLGVVHLLGFSTASAFSLEVIYAGASVLLLIGMGHIETLVVERQSAAHIERKVRSKWEARVEEKTRALEQLATDSARREQNEKTLLESEAQYRLLFAENPVPMCIFDLRSLQLLAANKSALRQYGFSQQEFTSRKVADLLARDCARAFMQDVAKPCVGVESRGVWRHKRKDGSLIDVEVAAVDIKYGGLPARVLLASDVTQRQCQELQERHAQKMDTIQQLAGGAAQHFNNIMTVIDGHANLLLQKSYDLSTAEQLKLISSAASRAAALTRQLLAVGGRHMMQKEVVDLNGIVRAASPMLRRLVGEFISLQTVSGTNLPPIEADKHLLEHIIVNLVLNARDAMPEGGTLTLSTSSVRIHEGRLAKYPNGRVGEFVCLAVKDTGTGMTAEVQEHLFEPFFTTKEPGKATGLGLASVHGAVKQHGGWMDFTTEVGQGTEFTIFFPSAAASAISAQRDFQAAIACTRETIMLVERDDRARGLARFVLNNHGFRVIEADNAETALLLWAGQAKGADLLLVDLNLSKGSPGPTLASQFIEAKPTLKVLYSFTPDVAEGEEPANPGSFGGIEVIAKPFTPERLLQRVEACLGNVSASAS